MPRSSFRRQECFYRTVRALGRLGFLCTSKPTILNAERTRLAGPWILAANHASVYDVPPIIRSCARMIDWVSITEIFAVPLLRFLYSSMGAFPINRAILDAEGLRVIYERLEAGRVVGVFPEGAVTVNAEATILQGHAPKAGLGKIAFATGAPIVPCVHVDTQNLAAPHRWLPLRLIRYGINFGEPLYADPSLGRRAAARKLEEEFVAAMQSLHAELMAVYAGSAGSPPTAPAADPAGAS